MNGLPANLKKEIQVALLASSYLDTDEDLRRLFVDNRIYYLRQDIPEAITPGKRVDALIAYLYEQTHTEHGNALWAFLQVVHDQLPVGDANRQHVQLLAEKLSAHLTQRVSSEFPSPFKGLQYFTEEDEDVFFGREKLVSDFLNHLRQHRFLAVVGASGSGKSSVIRAGLVPALRQGRIALNGGRSSTWPIYIITPRDTPLKALATVLTQDSESVTATRILIDDMEKSVESLDLFLYRETVNNPNTRILIIVDQFEELFTQCKDQQERQQFVGNLVQAVQSNQEGTLSLILILRADFYAPAVAFEPLRALLQAQQIIVGAMTADELRRAIAEPVRHSEWEFQPGLVDTILQDIGAGEGRQPEPGALPLLSHALLETWRNREGKMLTLNGYLQAGGVRQAIARTADKVYAQLAPEQQELAQNIFLRLVAIGEGTEYTRRRASLEELCAHSEQTDAIKAILKLLTDQRLITVDEDGVEVAHEALIREWPLLLTWLEQNREALSLQRRLTNAALEWSKNEHDASFLYEGVRLDNVEAWRSQGKLSLNKLEQAFLTASLERRQQEIEAEAQRIRREEQLLAKQRTLRRLRFLTAGLGVALSMAVMATVVAVILFNRASAAQAETEDLNRLIRINELAARSETLLATEPALSLLLALEGTWVEGYDDSLLTSAENSLRQGLGLISGRPLIGHQETVKDLAFSPDGRWLATASFDDTVRLWKMPVNAAQFATESVVLGNHPDDVLAVSFSRDGEWLATASEDGTVHLWPMFAGEKTLALNREPIVLRGHINAVRDVEFAPDGSWLATASDDNSIRLWVVPPPDAGSQFEPDFLVFSGHWEEVLDVAFSPDGQWLASGGNDDTLRLWPVPPVSAGAANVGAPVVLGGHGNDIRTVAFSRDGQWLASASFDKTARLWPLPADGWSDLVEKDAIELQGHTDFVRTVAFSPDGRWLATASLDDTVRLWAMPPTAETTAAITEAIELQGHTENVIEAVFSENGRWLASISDDNTIRLWPVPAGNGGGQRIENPVVLRGHEDNVAAMAFSAAGTWLATAGQDGIVRIWSTPANENVTAMPTDPVVLWAHDRTIRSLAFSSNGEWLVTAGMDQVAYLWSLPVDRVRDPIRLASKALAGHQSWISEVTFSPDNQWIASSSGDETVRLWPVPEKDAPSPETIEPIILQGHEDDVEEVAFSPDSRWLASAGLDKSVRLWNLTGLSGAPEIRTDALLLEGHASSVNEVVFSPDGRWLASSSLDQTVQIWPLPGAGVAEGTVNPAITMDSHDGEVLAMAISPGGEWLATASSDNKVHVWSVRALDENFAVDEEPFILTGHEGDVKKLSFSPGGRWLATGSADATVRIWALPDGDNENSREVFVLRAAENEIADVDFSPDGRWLATTSLEALVRLWRVAESEGDFQMAKNPILLQGHRGIVSEMVFGPDGAWLATGSQDTTVRLWRTQLAELTPLACWTIGRDLTADELALYFPEEDSVNACAQWLNTN